MPKLPFDLKPREEVMECIHESLIPRVPKFVLFVVWLLLPFFFLFPLFRMGVGGMIVFFVLLFSGSILFLRSYFQWSGTMFVLTDKRVIDIERRGFFDRVVTETAYAQIDEASYHIKGFWATIFRFGSIRLDLAGSAADIQFKRVHRPAHVHDLINEMRGEKEVR